MTSEQDHHWIQELLQSSSDDPTRSLPEKQIKIVEAAIEVFSEKGYSAASTNEIAKRAGVAEGTIFRHYKTKKDLLLSIVFPTLSKVVAPFLAKGFVKEVFQSEHTSFRELLRRLLLNRFQFAQKHSPALKIFLQEIAFHPEFKEQYQKIFGDVVLTQLLSVIRHYQEKGEIVDLPPETVARLIVTNIVGFLATRFLLLPDLRWDDEAEIEYTLDFILYGLEKRTLKGADDRVDYR